MKKESYRSKPPEKLLETTQEIPSTTSGEEGLGSSPSVGIGRGYSLPGEQTQLYDEDSKPELLSKVKKRRSRSVDSSRLKDLFIMLGDEMDSQEDIVLANFADFMLRKIAEQESLDYSSLFKDLLVKIVESDILDKNELILLLVDVFNRAILIGSRGGRTLQESKMEGYQASVARAKQHVR